MSLIRDLLLELSAVIKYYDPADFPNLKDGMKFTIRGVTYIFVSINNSDMETQNILLHELGHVYFGHIHLNCRASGWDRKQEKEADRYMLEYRAEEWLSQFNWEPEVIDYDAFIEYFELEKRHYNLIVEIFDEMIDHPQLNSCCM